MLDLINTHYKGISNENSLFWCHGQVGLEHEKVRKFRYPYWKYINVDDVRVILCVCKNCNMQFYGELAKGVPLNIPVRCDESEFYFQVVPVIINKKKQALVGDVIYKDRLRGLPTELINYQTKEFIEKAQ